MLYCNQRPLQRRLVTASCLLCVLCAYAEHWFPWHMSMDFVELLYKETRNFPREELYGLTSQLRRAAVSIPSNVAEGYCRRRTKVYVNHVSIALGSHAELETCIEIASRLGFIAD